MAEPSSTPSVGTRAVRGVAWLGMGQFARLAVSFLTSLMLTRLLQPSDFGLFSMTYLAVELAQLFTAFGFGAAIIQRQTQDEHLLSSCFWANLGIGLLVCTLMVAAGPLLEIYFKTSGLAQLLWPLAVNLMINAAMVVPQALLTQRLQFKQIAVAQVIGSAAAATSAVVAAASGAGVWTLAIQPLVGNIVTGGIMLHQSRWRPLRHFSFSAIRPLLGFSTSLLLGGLIDFLGRNMPNLIIGRILGAAALGFYSLATGLTGVVVFQVTSVIMRVLFPTLASIKDDRAAVKSAWFKAVSAITIASHPLMAGAIATAPDFIPTAFGAQWIPATVSFQMLCGLMAVQSSVMPSGSVTLAYGRADIGLKLTAVTTAGYGVALWIGSQFNLECATFGFALVGFASCLASTYFACRCAQISMRDWAREISSWTLSAALMGFLVAGVRLSLPDWSTWTRLVACIAVGCLAYAIMLYLFAGARLIALANDIREKFQR